MKVFINNEPHNLTPSQNLAAVLKEADLATQHGIAVAVNNIVIPKNNWDQCQLNNDDKKTIITATQGG